MIPKISIIIPCYNAVPYIDRAMESIVNQTIGIENLEIICVNDASTDNTYEKLLEWEAKYSDNIMVVTYEENLRQGGARNVGLTYASAEYVGFLDIDDWIEPDMYETLYNIMISDEYDVVKGKFIYEYHGSQMDACETDTNKREDQRYIFPKKNGWYVSHMQGVGNIGNYGSVNTAIYKKALILDNELWFPEKVSYEDNYWGEIFKLYIGRLYIADKIVYHYCINADSTTTNRNNIKQLERLGIECMILEKYKKLGAFDTFYEDLMWSFMERFFFHSMHIIYTRFDYIPDIMPYMKRKIMHYFPDYRNHPNMNCLSEFRKKQLEILEGDEKDYVEKMLAAREEYLTEVGLI